MKRFLKSRQIEAIKSNDISCFKTISIARVVRLSLAVVRLSIPAEVQVPLTFQRSVAKKPGSLKRWRNENGFQFAINEPSRWKRESQKKNRRRQNYFLFYFYFLASATKCLVWCLEFLPDGETSNLYLNVFTWRGKFVKLFCPYTS